MASKHLYVVNEVDLFEQLADGPITLDELLKRSGVPRRTIRILADAMVALGFADRQGDRFQNGAVSSFSILTHITVNRRSKWWSRSALMF
jgi:hypothetical protein